MNKLLYISIAMIVIACQSPQFQSVDVQHFAITIADTSIVRLDVRTMNEYNQGHIPGAILIDAMQNDFLTEAKKQLPANSTLAVYCRSGRRSKQAAKQLAAEGFRVVELNNGFNAWIAAGYDIE